MTSTTRTPQLAAGVGLVITLAVTALPIFAPQLLADHLRATYPGYSTTQIGDAVALWQTILTVLGAFAAVAWGWTLLALRAGKRWVPWSATALLTVAVIVAVTLLTVQDTSGAVGLAPALGWAWAAPCLAGVAVTVTTWRSRRSGRPSVPAV